MKKFLIIFLTLSSLQYAQFFSWEIYGNMEKPIAGGDVWHNNNALYVIGGYSDSLQTNVNWVQKLNLDGQVWAYDSMSAPRFGLVSESYNGGAYFYGGIDNELNSISGIERWEDTFTDEAVFSFNNNFNRIFSTGHIINDNFYIIGGNPLPGTSLDSLPYIVKYNLSSKDVTFQLDTLFLTGDLPEQQMSEVIDDDIFIFGGVINGISQDIYKFNISTQLYEKLPINLREPRAGGRAVIGTEPNIIYIIGGYNESSKALNSVEIFTDYGNNIYDITTAPPIQNARYNFMSAFVDNYIYIMGGFDEEGNVVETIEILQIDGFATNIDSDFKKNIQNSFRLYQNYPNPFNPTTIIKYAIPLTESVAYQFVELKIYDIIGNEISTLIEKEQGPGIYQVEFDASQFPSGVYYYQLKSNTFIQTNKMILIK